MHLSAYSSCMSSDFELHNSIIFCVIKLLLIWAGALVSWLWEETHIPKVVGSNPVTVYWMDIFSHIFVVKI